MAGELKSAYELALEKMAKRDDDRRPLSQKQKERIASLRKDLRASVAEREIMLQANLARLSERVPPAERAARRSELESEFQRERKALVEECEVRIQSIRERGEGSLPEEG